MQPTPFILYGPTGLIEKQKVPWAKINKEYLSELNYLENAIKGINWNDLLAYTDVEADSGAAG